MNHESEIAELSNQIRSLKNIKGPIKIKKSVDSHFVPNPYDKRDTLPKLDISGLTNIINIDTKNLICTAEPSVTFERLIKETLNHSLIPYTVPELKGITLGGAVSGCSIESMSYRYGGFHDSCFEYEVLTGYGDIVTCSKEKNSELFEMIHGSYGTIGIITKIKFKLYHAKPFVKMEYRKYPSIDAFNNAMNERIKAEDFDFIDGIIHSKNEFVLCLGNMVSSAPRVSKYDWLEIFYKSTSKLNEDYLEISDYLFRYDTECHWLTKTVPLMETKPARLLFGKFVLGSTNLIKWSKKLKSIMKLKKRPEVVVDVFIPSSRFKEFYNWYEKDFDFYPLWIVPYKIAKMYPWVNADHAAKMHDNIFIDCAVYGKPNNKPNIDYSELLEKKTIELAGIKTLISRNHFTKDEFWKAYNKDGYYALKNKYDPNGLFMDLYEKFAPRNY